MFSISYCYFNFYSSFKVLFIADAKISFDSFRNGMSATVNSKTIITVNPGKIFSLTCDTKTRLKSYFETQTSQRWRTVYEKIESSCCASRIFSVRKTFQSHHFSSETREASLLFSYAKEVSESGALEQDEKPEDIPGRLI